MQKMNLAGIDLNLLVVLDALLNETHVGRAGHRVGLSQPAASHALARLRMLFDDPLLVRAGTAMVLTPRAEALRGPVAQFIGATRAVLENETFEPRASRRRFRCMMPDLVFHLLMPPLLRRLQGEAPGIVVECVAWRGPELLTLPALREIDFIVTSLDREIPGFERHRLYEDRDVIVVRASYPERERLGSVKGLSSLQHVAVVGAGERVDVLDIWLTSVGIIRDVAAVAPNYLVALGIASKTDLVAIVPRKFAASMADGFGLELFDLPLDPGIDVLDILSPARAHADPATIWMRQRLCEVAADL